MHSRQKDRGAAAVEFALVLPFLLLLICGIVDFGRAYNARITLTHAAREGVRTWAITGDEVKTQERIAAAAVGVTGLEVPPRPPCVFGEQTTVTVTAPFSYITPIIADLVPAIGELSAEGVMRCEH